jgi:hypothetical protein
VCTGFKPLGVNVNFADFCLGIGHMIKSFGQFYIHTRGFDSHTDTLRQK